MLPCIEVASGQGVYPGMGTRVVTVVLVGGYDAPGPVVVMTTGVFTTTPPGTGVCVLGPAGVMIDTAPPPAGTTTGWLGTDTVVLPGLVGPVAGCVTVTGTLGVTIAGGTGEAGFWGTAGTTTGPLTGLVTMGLVIVGGLGVVDPVEAGFDALVLVELVPELELVLGFEVSLLPLPHATQAMSMKTAMAAITFFMVAPSCRQSADSEVLPDRLAC